MPPGYSGTPLAQKLGLKPGMAVWFDGMPSSVLQEIALPDLQLLAEPVPGLRFAHLFVTRQADLAARLQSLRPLIDPAGQVWVSWPKKAAKVPTDITEDRIRDLILGVTDWVDVKVCAVDAVWSGLKLVIRKAAR